MRKLLVLLLSLAAISFACKKNESIGKVQLITLSYLQTYCADPWQTSTDDNTTIANATAYLRAAGLFLASMQIKSEGDPQACLACQCKTGKIIYVSTLKIDSIVSKYLAIGFRQ